MTKTLTPDDILHDLMHSIAQLLIRYIKEGHDQNDTAQRVALLTVRAGAICMGCLTKRADAGTAVEAARTMVITGLADGVTLREQEGDYQAAVGFPVSVN